MMYSKWLSLSLDTRNKIADKFGIIRKGQIEVYSNTVKVDGYLVEDIEAALTIEAMRNFVGANSDVENRDILSDMVIRKIEGPVVTGTPEPEKVIASGTFDGKIEVMKPEPIKKKDLKPSKIVKVKKVAKKVTKKNAKK